MNQAKKATQVIMRQRLHYLSRRINKQSIYV